MEDRTVSLEEMLSAREERVARQNQLLEEFQLPLVCLNLNIPGPVKTSPKYEKMFEIGVEQIRKVLRKTGIEVLFDRDIRRKTGYESYMVVKADALQIKKLMMPVEDETELGRIFDVDIIKENGEKVSRTEVGAQSRKCLLCGDVAQVCSRSRKHTVKELVEYINGIEI